jgi:hypothetical protein
MILGLVTAGVLLAGASSAWANSISVTATPGVSAITVYVTGTSDSCELSCSSYSVAVEVRPDSDDQCIEDDPQFTAPLPAAGGPFDLTTTIAQGGGEEYTVCAFLNLKESGFSGALDHAQTDVTLAPTACPPGAGHALSLSGATRIAYGRQGMLSVSDPGDEEVGASATLTMRRVKDTAPFYSYAFTRGNLNHFDEAGGPLPFSVTLRRSDGPAVITLTYLQDGGGEDGLGRCFDQRTLLITPVAGRLPGVRVREGLGDDPRGAGVTFTVAGGCALAAPAPVQVTVRGHGATSTLRSRDLCTGGWRVRGHTPSISTRRKPLTNLATTIEFHSAGPINQVYRVTIRVAGRVVRTAQLQNFYSSTPSTRVWQGTDAFVNYCIDTGQTLYSQHLRLYCIRGGSTHRQVTLH